MDNKILNENLHLECYRMADSGWEIVPSSSKRDWMEATDGLANKCLPLLAANQMGWVILSPSDVSVIWDGGKAIESTKIIVHDEKYKKNISSHFGHGIFTFQVPYIFRTNEEIGLFVRGATNFWVENAQPLDGFVETNWSNYSFTMNWKVTSPDKVISLKKGDPICMLIPYPVRLLENVKVTYKSFLEAPESMKSVFSSWAKYRNEFNNNKEREKGSWQKDYFLGRKCPFSGDQEDNKGSPHRTKYNLPRFED